jgi:hypothetical protein
MTAHGASTSAPNGASSSGDLRRWTPLDAARFSEIFAGMYRGEIADVVDNSNAILMMLR